MKYRNGIDLFSDKMYNRYNLKIGNEVTIKMQRMIYADNAATTRLSEKAFEAMKPYFCEYFGNASSLYQLGGQSQKAVDNARMVIAKCLNAQQPSNIYFTSGGSESDNWAIKGAAELGERKGKKHIISSKFEHHAVLHTLEYLEKHGFDKCNIFTRVFS